MRFVNEIEQGREGEAREENTHRLAISLKEE